MTTFTVGPTTISSTELVSPSTNVPSGIQAATITMTACPEWSTATGFFSWGVEISTDGGTTWTMILNQGYTDPHALAIGSPGKAGLSALPILRVVWDRTVANTRARMKAKTDGATLTCTFQVDTSP